MKKIMTIKTVDGNRYTFPISNVQFWDLDGWLLVSDGSVKRSFNHANIVSTKEEEIDDG